MSVLELPDQTVPLEHQIAGHRHENGNLYTGMLKHIDGYVMKPVQNNQRGKTEIEFYEQIFKTAHPTLTKLKCFLPNFFGLHQFVSDSAIRYYIKMEDIAAGMLKPCIADVKIGRQTWDPYSSPEKQLAENLPDQTVPLEHQIAGHRHENGNLYTGMLKHIDGYVMKPVQNNQRGKTEIEFYEQIFKTAHPTLTKLKCFLPNFFGLHQFVSDSAIRYYIKMEDIAAGMLKPCIADVKIGRQTWDPYSSPEKQLAENMKYSGTKQPLAFCIPGMSIYDLASGQVLKLDKYYGRSLNSDTIRDALRVYFNSTKVVENRLLAEILRQLNAVRVWFEDQRHFLFYATSLLLVYDADLLKDGSNVLNVRIRMIDFAHVYPAQNSRDANYLEGLCKKKLCAVTITCIHVYPNVVANVYDKLLEAPGTSVEILPFFSKYLEVE